MKIVYIANSIIPSRTANSIQVMKMCQAFADNGHHITLLIPNKYREYEPDIKDIHAYYGVKNNFNIIKLSYNYIPYFRQLYYILHVYFKLKSLKPEVVYNRKVLNCYFASYFSKTICEAHSPPSTKLEKFMLTKLLLKKNCKKLVAISRQLRNTLVNEHNIPQTKLFIAPDGADKVNNFSVILKKSSKLRVGYSGHLYAGRGIDVILALAQSMQDLNFHIVGGEEKDIQYWQSMSNSNNITFHGFVSPSLIQEYRNSFDILIAPYQTQVSTSGSGKDIANCMSPLKIFEYMASKKAIVCSNLPTLQEILTHERNSLLVQCDKLKDWTDAIERLKDKSLRDKLANQAHQDFIEKYSWKQRVKNIINSTSLE